MRLELIELIEQIKNLKLKNTDLETELTEVKKQRDESDKAIITLNSKIEDLSKAISKDAVDDKDNLLLVKELEEKLSEKDREIVDLKKEQVAPIEPVIDHYEKIIEGFWPNLFKGQRTKSLVERFWRWIA